MTVTKRDLSYAKCRECNWVYFIVTRNYAIKQVKEFNEYYDSLTKEEQQSYYRSMKSDIKSYEHCNVCGAHYKTFLKARKHEIPNGSTISPIIWRKY